MKFFEQGMDLSRAMMSSITKTGNQNYIGPSTFGNNPQNQYIIDDGRGGFEDVSWVLG